MTKAAQVAQIIAREIVAGSRKHWAGLHADALQEIQTMPTPTSSTLNGDQKGQPRVAIDRGATTSFLQSEGSKLPADSTTEPYQPTPVVIKPVDFKSLAGSYPGDHRQPQTAGDVTAPFRNQAGPRGETGTKGA